MTGFQLQGNAAQRYEQFVAPIMGPFLAATVDAAQLQPGAAVLDVACGTGFVARAVVAAIPDATAHGVDLNEAMLAQAAAASADLPITYQQAPADRLPFDAGTFDAVICQQGLQFFPDPQAALDEMARVAKPAGRIVVTVWAPIARSPYMTAQRHVVAEIIGAEAAAGLDAAFAFSDERLLAVFSDAGLRDVAVSEILADVTLPDLATFARGHFEALPWGAMLAQKPNGLELAADIMVRELQPYLAEDGAATVTFGSWLATGIR